MIGIDIKALDNVKPCIYCGKDPKLVIKYFMDMSESKEITCLSDREECVVLNYVKVHDNNIEDAIKQWNENNS